MPSGLIALLDDVATIAKIAAASVDDVGLAVGKAGTKAAGVVIDDTAVTPRYVTGFTPERELPIIGKIALGSFRTVLDPHRRAGALGAAAVVITPFDDRGAYLVFEGAEKIVEKVTGVTMRGRTARGDTPRSSRSGRSPALFAPTSTIRQIMIIALRSLPNSTSGCGPQRWARSALSSPSWCMARRADREAG